MRVDVCVEAAIGSYKAGMESHNAAIQDGWAVRMLIRRRRKLNSIISLV